MTILMLDKNKPKSKSATTDKGNHYIKTKGSIHKEYITTVNIYALNIGAPKYIK